MGGVHTEYYVRSANGSDRPSAHPARVSTPPHSAPPHSTQCYQKDRARPLTVSDKEGLLDGGGGLGLGLWTKVHKPSFAGEDDSEVPSALLLGRHDERRTPWSVYRSSRRAEVVVCFGDDDPTTMAVETADAYGALRAISRSVTKVSTCTRVHG